MKPTNTLRIEAHIQKQRHLVTTTTRSLSTLHGRKRRVALRAVKSALAWERAWRWANERKEWER